MNGFRLLIHCLHNPLLLLRLELRTVVDIYELLVADMHDHVDFAVAVHVLKVGGSRSLLRVVTDNRRAVIDAGMSNITTGQLNDYHAAFQVEKNKMGGMIGTVGMADYFIDLVGARRSVGSIQLMLTPPSTKHLKRCPERERSNHADTDIQQPVRLLPRRRLIMDDNPFVPALENLLARLCVADRAGRGTLRIICVVVFGVILLGTAGARGYGIHMVCPP